MEYETGWFGLARAYGGRRDRGAREGGEPGCTAADRAWKLRYRLGIRDRMLLEAWLARDCREDLVGALDTYKELVARWPDDRETVTGLAEMLSWLHMGGQAVPVAEEGLRKFPNDRRLKEILASSLQDVGRLAEAIDLFRQLASEEPARPDHWANIGDCFLQLAMPDSAEVAFQRALDIDRDANRWALAEAAVRFHRGDTEGAISGLRGLDTYGLSAAATNEIKVATAALLAERGQFTEATRLVPATIDEGKAWYKLVLLRGYIRFLLAPDPRGLDVLREELEKALRGVEDAQTPIARFRACWAVVGLAAGLDSTEVAKPCWRAMPTMIGSEFPPNAYWLMTCVEFSLADGRSDDALNYFESLEKTAITRPPREYFDIMRRTYKARAYRMVGRYEEAAAMLEELLHIYRGHWLAYYELGQVYEEMERFPQAISAYTAFLEGWANADSGLVQVQHARRRLAALERMP